MAKKTTISKANMNKLTQQMMMGAMIRPMGYGMAASAMQNTKPQEQRIYYVAIDGQQAGPYTLTELSSLISQGRMNNTTLVWKQGMASWQQAGLTPEVMTLFSAPKKTSSAAPKNAPPAAPPAPGQSAVADNIMPPPPAAKTAPLELPKQSWENYYFPAEGILDEEIKHEDTGEADSQDQARIIRGILSEFGIEAKITGIIRGPVVTMFEILPPPGLKLTKITELESNIALRLAAKTIRILAPIPGKTAVGIEVPNKKRELVNFKTTIESCMAAPGEKALPLYLGKTISGELLSVDLAAMPHLLVAGTTGSGKSVCINTMILSLVYRLTPAQCRMIFIDPKIVELKTYDDIPHLLTPVITDSDRALTALRYCVDEMESRYERLGKASSRNIKSFNKEAAERGDEIMPYIVLIIDEFADLMAVSGKETESLISRLAAKSRAIGIHLVLATQRPSVNVITGLIKSNIPSRIAFMVPAMVDSRVILDSPGAEKLLGKGDMLYAGSDSAFPIRAQGAFVCEDEAERAADHLRSLGKPEYVNM